MLYRQDHNGNGGDFVPVLACLFAKPQKPNKRQRDGRRQQATAVFVRDQRREAVTGFCPVWRPFYIPLRRLSHFRPFSRLFDVPPISQHRPAHKSPLNRLKSPYTGQHINKPFQPSLIQIPQ